MYYSTRQEGFDDPRPTLRGPCFDLGGLCAGGSGSCFLRSGFLLQFVSLSALFLSYWINGGWGLFGYELDGMNEEARNASAFRITMAFWSGVYLLGSVSLMFFQATLSDDACWARGFRAGSKVFRLGAFFDVLSSIMQFIFYLYISKFYTEKWYTHFLEGASERVFFSYIRCMHAIALFLFGAATYLMEVYHDEGAGDLHAYINTILFFVSGTIEFFVMFFDWSCIASVFIWLTLAAVTTWSFFLSLK